MSQSLSLTAALGDSTAGEDEADFADADESAAAGTDANAADSHRQSSVVANTLANGVVRSSMPPKPNTLSERDERADDSASAAENSSAPTAQGGGTVITLPPDASAGALASARPVATPAEPTLPRTESLVQDTFMSRDSWDAALLSAGGVCRAVDYVMDTSIDPPIRRVFCAVRPPGHHAGVSGKAHATSQGFVRALCAVAGLVDSHAARSVC